MTQIKPAYVCVDKQGRKKYVEEPSDCSGNARKLMNGSERVALSKLMSALLRHIPHTVGLVLNDEGWTNISELVKAIKERWRNKEKYQWVTEDHVRAVAYLDPKGRFEVKGNRIRARYGHSVPAKVKYPEDCESKILYHGTTLRNVTSIMSKGLLPGRRLWVHLSVCVEDAIETGLRHGKDVRLLVVDAGCLREKGIKVYAASKRVRLVSYVPPECITEVLKPEEIS